MPDTICPFKIPRKANLWSPRKKYKPTKAIKDIQYVGEKEAVCISVEAKDHLYVTEGHNLTHNTVTFSHVPQALNAQRTLIIAHRDELLNQAYEKFISVPGNERFTVEFERRSEYASDKANVVIASIQSLQANWRYEKFESSYFDCIIIDELHHYLAPTYREVLCYFKPKALIGFTATPTRSDEQPMTDVFTDGEIYSISIDYLIKHGYLVPYDIQSIPAFEYSPESIFLAWYKHADNKKTIIFVSSVDEAETVAHNFNSGSVPAAAIHAGLSREERQEILKDFNQNRLLVLVNCQTLTEGFDEPAIECVIIGRNVNFQGLKMQIIGRGLRLFPGKDKLLVLELEPTQDVDAVMQETQFPIHQKVIDLPASQYTTTSIVPYTPKVEKLYARPIPTAPTFQYTLNTYCNPEDIAYKIGEYAGFVCRFGTRTLLYLSPVIILLLLGWLIYHVF